MHFVDDCFSHKVDRKILFMLRGRRVGKGGVGGCGKWGTKVWVDLNGPLAVGSGGGGPLGGGVGCGTRCKTYVNQFPRCDLRRTSGVDADVDVALLRRFSPSADMCFPRNLSRSLSLSLSRCDDLSVLIV